MSSPHKLSYKQFEDLVQLTCVWKTGWLSHAVDFIEEMVIHTH